MEIKTLNQLKSITRLNRKLLMTAHRQPGYAGKLWYVNYIRTDGFYCAVDGIPERHMNGSNGWGGILIRWRREAFWEFENSVCEVYDSGKEHTKSHLLMAFRVLE